MRSQDHQRLLTGSEQVTHVARTRRAVNHVRRTTTAEAAERLPGSGRGRSGRASAVVGRVIDEYPVPPHRRVDFIYVLSRTGSGGGLALPRRTPGSECRTGARLCILCIAIHRLCTLVAGTIECASKAAFPAAIGPRAQPLRPA